MYDTFKVFHIFLLFLLNTRVGSLVVVSVHSQEDHLEKDLCIRQTKIKNVDSRYDEKRK